MKWNHKKRSVEQAWQSVELDQKGLEDFYSGGGMIVEELDDKEAERYLSGFKKSKKAAEPVSAVEPKKEKKAPKKKAVVIEDVVNTHPAPVSLPAAPVQPNVKTPKSKKQETLQQVESVKDTHAPNKPANPKTDTAEQDNSPLPDMSAWSSMNLHAKVVSSVAKLRFANPTAIQVATIPEAIATNKDVIAAAETGSGKTLAFGLPIISKILTLRDTLKSKGKDEDAKARSNQPFGLIILPTRELATQVKDQLSAACPSVSSVVVVGGMSVEKQHRLLKRNPEIVIGTPGRLAGVLGLASQTNKDLDAQVSGYQAEQQCTELRERLPHCAWLVLDEADRLVEEGHFKDLKELLNLLYTVQKEEAESNRGQKAATSSPASTPLVPSVQTLQTFIFSATLATADKDLSALTRLAKLQKERIIVDLAKPAGERKLPDGLAFDLLLTEDKEREGYLVARILKHFFTEHRLGRKAVVFVNAITYVYRLTSLLRTLAGIRGIRVVGLHSGIKQKDRLQRLDQFKQADNAIVVATDLAARGLDLAEVGLVVHMQPPREAETLVHRSGRTARAGKSGEVCLVVAPKEIPTWRKVYFRATGNAIESVIKFIPNPTDLARAKEILSLAAEIEGGTHREAKQRKEDAWRAKAAEDCDLVLSDDDADSDPEVMVDGKVVKARKRPVEDDDRASFEQAKQRKAVQTLKELMQQPIPSALKKSKYAL